MGADFLYTIIPKAEPSDERKAKLAVACQSVPITRDDAEMLLGSDNVEEAKQVLAKFANEYWELGQRRDTSTLKIKPQDPAFIITGGMSWGDGPTETYDQLCVIENLTDIWDLLLEWAEEDVKK